MEIGGYELGTIIHMGANGPLWLTETSKGPGIVAIRGEREARGSVDRWRAWAGIDSPHVVRLLDVVRHEDGQWAVVQEYVEGRPLDIALASHALRSPRTRRRVWEGVAAGVSALHEAGIVHGDISPANIIVDPQGRAVIIDIIDPPRPGAGTRGWSLGAPEGREGDEACADRIGELLGVDPSDADSGGTDADSPVLVDGGVVDPAQIVADLRAAALREDTLAPSRAREGAEGGAEHGGAPGRSRRRVAAMLALAVVLFAVGGVLVWRSGAFNGAPQTPTGQSAEGAGAGAAPEEQPPSDPCAAGAVEARLGAAIRARDAAIVAGDASALDGVVGGALADADRKRIESLAEQGITVEKLETQVRVEEVVACTDSLIRARAALTQTALRACANGTCTDASAQPAQEVVLDIERASGLVVAAQGASGQSGAEGR